MSSLTEVVVAFNGQKMHLQPQILSVDGIGAFKESLQHTVLDLLTYARIRLVNCRVHELVSDAAIPVAPQQFLDALADCFNRNRESFQTLAAMWAVWDGQAVEICVAGIIAGGPSFTVLQGSVQAALSGIATGGWTESVTIVDSTVGQIPDVREAFR